MQGLKISITRKELRKLRYRSMRYRILSRIPFASKRAYYSNKKEKTEHLLAYFKHLDKTASLVVRDELDDGGVPAVAREDPAPVELKERTVKAIPFYLPQYHTFPLNDAVWGKGFTEWTMVRRATPHYPGHYHPIIPGDFGYYDLRDMDVRRTGDSCSSMRGMSGAKAPIWSRMRSTGTHI